jgi:hypothetical protein
MSEDQVQSLMIQDGDEKLEIAIYTKNPVDFQPSQLPPDSKEDDEYESKGAKDVAITSMQEVHKYIRFYTKYAIGAFKNFAGADIEEINLKFGLKIGGKTGVPMLTEGSGEANFEIEVKCKFPEAQQ